MNFLGPKVTTKDNGDGTQTVTTISYKADGTKVVKRKTEPIRKHVPDNPNRATRNSFTSVASLEGVKQVLQEVLGTPHGDNNTFAKAVNRAIPGEFVLLASQDDVTQAQEDYYAKDHYGLPDNKFGKAGSVATCALLQLMQENPKRFVGGSGGVKPWDCRQILHQIKTRVQKASKLEAKPTISSSRPLGPPALNSNQYAPFYIVPPGYTGKRRALLIGVVSGEGEDLKGPPNDIVNIQNMLIQHCGFKREDITVLRDDIHARGGCKPSTKKNILDGFDKLVKLSKPNDLCFVQFSGHGGRLGDNLYILPSDYKQNGHILDDDILLDLIKYMPAQVHTTMLVDCCYSGVIGDLPYTLNSSTEDGDPQRIGTYYDTNTRSETIQQEAAPTQEYLAKKEARSKWKNVTRLKSIAATYASEFAKEVEKGSSAFAGQAREVLEKKKAQAAVAASNAASSARQAAANANQSARQAAAAANQHARTQAANLRRSRTTPVPENRTTTPPSKDDSATATPPAPAPAYKKPPGLARSSTTDIPRQRQARSKSPTREPGLRRSATTTPTPTPRQQTTPKPAPEQQASSRSIPTPAPAPAPAPASRPPIRRVHTTQGAPSRSPGPRYNYYDQQQQQQPLRRTKTAEEEAREFEEAARRAAVGRKDVAAERSTPRRSTSFEDDVDAKSTPRRSISFEADDDIAEHEEEAARKAAVEESRREAEKARQAAVEQSRREAAAARERSAASSASPPPSPGGRRSKQTPRRCRTMEEVAMEREMYARKAAVERSKREAAEARDAKTMEDMANMAFEREEQARKREEEAARREAVERSRREREEEEARRAAYSADEAARREAVERSRKEREEAAARRAANSAEEAARREAVERSRREREEEAARREAVERSRREREEEMARRAANSSSSDDRSRREIEEEAERRDALERFKREQEEEARRAGYSADEEARMEREAKSRREKEEARREEEEAAARREAVERSKREAAEARNQR